MSAQTASALASEAVRRQIPSAVTVTVNTPEANAVFPALSVAVAVIVVTVGFVAPTKSNAGPDTTAGQLVVAMPDRSSVATQVMRTVSSTVYVPAFPMNVMSGAVV